MCVCVCRSVSSAKTHDEALLRKWYPDAVPTSLIMLAQAQDHSEHWWSSRKWLPHGLVPTVAELRLCSDPLLQFIKLFQSDIVWLLLFLTVSGPLFGLHVLLLIGLAFVQSLLPKLKMKHFWESDIWMSCQLSRAQDHSEHRWSSRKRLPRGLDSLA